MLKCNYCGRLFKKNHESCPGCGAAQFEELNNMSNIVISTPPEGGYKIDLSNVKRGSLIFKIFYYVGIFMGIMVIPFIFVSLIPLFLIPFFGFSFVIFDILFSIVPLFIALLFFIIGKKGLKRVKQNMKKLDKLRYAGVLVKNLSYDIVESGSIVNGNPIYAIKVVYSAPNGVEIPLTSEAKYDGQLSRKDGTVDLLIDPDDYTNYYIDFEIY